jgi:hypothetical protein
MNKNTDIETRHSVELRTVILYRGKMIDDFLLDAKSSVSEEKLKV